MRSQPNNRQHDPLRTGQRQSLSACGVPHRAGHPHGQAQPAIGEPAGSGSLRAGLEPSSGRGGGGRRVSAESSAPPCPQQSGGGVGGCSGGGGGGENLEHGQDLRHRRDSSSDPGPYADPELQSRIDATTPSVTQADSPQLRTPAASCGMGRAGPGAGNRDGPYPASQAGPEPFNVTCPDSDLGRVPAGASLTAACAGPGPGTAPVVRTRDRVAVTGVTTGPFRRECGPVVRVPCSGSHSGPVIDHGPVTAHGPRSPRATGAAAGGLAPTSELLCDSTQRLGRRPAAAGAIPRVSAGLRRAPVFAVPMPRPHI